MNWEVSSMAKKQFKAESKRLLDLMINSIYTHKEIFLREIISNASDAIDKLAYLALTDDKVGLNRKDFHISITVDEENRTITVSDNGIGMTKEEMEQNLGTIAKSGSLQFKQEMETAKNIDIIGQFGVGFYSAFMVAQKVQVYSKKYGSEESWVWESEGADGYTVSASEKTTVGTDIVMYLKEDTEDEKYTDYLNEYTIRGLITKYSDYIHYPIQMDVTKYRSVEDPQDSTKKISEEYKETETLNNMQPIWTRQKSKVKQEDYDQFFRDKFGAYEAPLSTLRVSVEGQVSYTALLFIPAKAPMDYYTKDYKKGLQLYSSGVMIMDACEELLPDCFRFVRGVVDSQDLNLNISREMLQHDRAVKLIATNLEKKIKNELDKLQKNDREKYETFFGQFGEQIKYGIVADYGQKKEMLQDLLLFWSAKQNKLVTLKEYLEAMPEGQEKIYYAAGENKDRLVQLPQSEVLLSKGFDILVLTDEVDEFCLQMLGIYQEKEFSSVVNGENDSQAEEKAKSDEIKPIIDFVKETLGSKTADVRLSENLGNHAVSVIPEEGMSFEMEKFFSKRSPEAAFHTGRVLLLNPEHKLFEMITNLHESDPEKAKKIVEFLYNQGLLMADLPIEDPTAYTDLLCELIQA